MRAPLSYVPALPACTGMVAGIAVSALLPWWIPAAICVVAFVLLYRRRHHYAASFFLMTAIGAAAAAVNTPVTLPPDFFSTQPRTCSARVVYAAERPQGMVYTVDVDSVDGQRCRPFRCRVTVKSVAGQMEPGWRFRFTRRLQDTSVSDAVIPGMPDYNRMLRLDGVAARAYLMSSDISDITPARGFDAFVNSMRRALFNAIVSSPVSGETSAFLTAVILGDDIFITPDRQDMYRSSGVAHLMAVSGLHVGIIAMLLAFALFPLKLHRSARVPRLVATAVLVWLYVLVVGAHPPVLRAAVMITVMLAAAIVQRGASPWNSLFLSVAILLFLHPMWLYSPGFQLSVAAVATLLLFMPLVPGKLCRHPLLYNGLSLLVIPTAAILGTGIVTAIHFGSVPLLFLPANIVCGILFPIILSGGFVLMLLQLCGISFGLLGILVDACMWLMDGALSLLPAAALHTAGLSPWVAVPYCATIVLLALSLRRVARPRALWMLTGAAAIATAATVVATWQRAPRAEAYLTARAGRAELLMCRDNHVWLKAWPDATDTSAADHYAPFMERRGSNEIEMATDLDTAEYATGADYAIVGSKVVVCAQAGKTVSAPEATDIYVLVTSAYRGSMADLCKMYPEGVFVLSPDLHPSQRARLLRECPDSLPVVDLRRTTLRLL